MNQGGVAERQSPLLVDLEVIVGGRGCREGRLKFCSQQLTDVRFGDVYKRLKDIGRHLQASSGLVNNKTELRFKHGTTFYNQFSTI